MVKGEGLKQRDWAAKQVGLSASSLATGAEIKRAFLKTLAGETLLPTPEQWDAFQILHQDLKQPEEQPEELNRNLWPNYDLAEERRLCQAVVSFSDDLWKVSQSERAARYAELAADCEFCPRAADWLRRLEPSLQVDLEHVKREISAAPAELKKALEDLCLALREIHAKRALSATVRRAELLDVASKNPVVFRKAAEIVQEKIPAVAALDSNLVAQLQVRAKNPKTTPARPTSQKQANQPTSYSEGPASKSKQLLTFSPFVWVLIGTVTSLVLGALVMALMFGE
jgi:hypothetical protein